MTEESPRECSVCSSTSIVETHHETHITGDFRRMHICLDCGVSQWYGDE